MEGDRGLDGFEGEVLEGEWVHGRSGREEIVIF